MPLALVRTPTYRRPDLLRRAIACLQAQTFQDWVCEVRDDCPDASARAVVEDIGDPRVHYIQNRPQKFMTRNLDDCFLKENPFKADFFCMLEDDNQMLPGFLARGREIIEQTGVTACMLNQVIEYNSRTPEAYVGTAGIFDGIYDERVYQPEEIHLATFGSIGVSNGALFWSRNIRSSLAVVVDTIPTLEEYLRTYLISEPLYVCREHLAVWASNETSTARNLGLAKSRVRRELDLKASVTSLQRAIWARTPEPLREEFLEGGVLRLPLAGRRQALRKAGIFAQGVPHDPDPLATVKRLSVRYVGRVHPSVGAVLARSTHPVLADQ